MQIVQFRAENFKRLTAVEITPDGNVVHITGRNGQGKSIVLDGIWWAIGGREGAKDITRAVRDGEDEAIVEIEFDDLIVTKTEKADGKPKLTVRAKDGASYGSPQKMLDSLVGRICFDPLEFTRLDGKKQVEQLVALVDLPFDPADMAAKRKGAFDERTDVNRDFKAAQARLAAMPRPPADLPAGEISASDLVQQLQSARAQIDANRYARESVTRAETEFAQAQVQVLQQQMDDAIARVAETQKVVEQRTEAASDLIDPDTAGIEVQISGLDETNAAVRAEQARQKLDGEVRALSKQWGELDDRIKALDEQKATALAAAQMPVIGLAWDDDGVTFKGVPLAQCSSAEQLRVSTAIAMAGNPEIRVISIADGSLLDSDSLRVIETMAEAHDFQVWIESVSETGDMGVVIEDGTARTAVPA